MRYNKVPILAPCTLIESQLNVRADGNHKKRIGRTTNKMAIDREATTTYLPRYIVHNRVPTIVKFQTSYEF